MPVSPMLSLRSSSARWLSVLMARGTLPLNLLLPSRNWVRKLAEAMAFGSVPDRLFVVGVVVVVVVGGGRGRDWRDDNMEKGPQRQHK